VAAGLVAAALPIAWMTLRGIQVQVARTTATAHPALGGEGWASAPQRLFHVLSWRGFVTLLHEMEMPFARLLGVWFIAFVAISAVLTMFPLSLIQAFGVSVRLPATTYAFAAAVSLLLYPLAASAAKKHGARRVLRAGFAARTVAIAILTVAFLSQAGDLPLVLAGFVITVMAWPLLGVSGTALAAELAHGEKGEALGLFNASSSLAGAIGAFLGGWATEAFSYGTVCLMGTLAVALAVLLSGDGNSKRRAATGALTNQEPPAAP
jgi:MFS family permease